MEPSDILSVKFTSTLFVHLFTRTQMGVSTMFGGFEVQIGLDGVCREFSESSTYHDIYSVVTTSLQGQGLVYDIQNIR